MLEVFQSVEDVWVIWIITVMILAYSVRRALRGFSWASVKRFSKSEAGASYALAYVLTFPFYLLLMAMLLQASLILMCKIGTSYSAYCTARTVTAWQGHEPSSSDNIDYAKHYLRYKAKRAATMAMVPFANSYPHKDLFPAYPISLYGPISLDDVDLTDQESIEEFLDKGGVDFGSTFANLLTTIDRIAYVAMYKQLNETAHQLDTTTKSSIIKNSQSRVQDSYIEHKYDYAAAATRIYIPDETVAWNDDLEVKIKYRMTFHIPGTARIFMGKKPDWSKHFYRDIETTVVIPSEAAESEDGKIGIPYNTYFLKL